MRRPPSLRRPAGVGRPAAVDATLLVRKHDGERRLGRIRVRRAGLVRQHRPNLHVDSGVLGPPVAGLLEILVVDGEVVQDADRVLERVRFRAAGLQRQAADCLTLRSDLLERRFAARTVRKPGLDVEVDAFRRVVKPVSLVIHVGLDGERPELPDIARQRHVARRQRRGCFAVRWQVLLSEPSVGLARRRPVWYRPHNELPE